MKDKKSLIYKKAKKLFLEKGFKDTNISELAASVGISVGSFYTYYPSKEKLFMEIFLDENAALKQRCLLAIDRTQSPLVVVHQMLALNAQGIRANPILREWYNERTFTKLEKVYREEHGSKATYFLYDSFLELIEQWQKEHSIRNDIDSKMIMMIFAAIINIDAHKEEIGIDYFPTLLEIMTDLIMKGLATDPV
ncbi:MAG: TetR/AcrR family transcriptional regulator [Sphaerochaetaceae bacterium]|nr:TetR/AcrR family transcriptional regulator [Sphaerochaetaceae bacterium]